MAYDQSINRDFKSKGVIIGIRHNSNNNDRSFHRRGRSAFSIASGVVMPDGIAQRLVESTETESTKMNEFI